MRNVWDENDTEQKVLTPDMVIEAERKLSVKLPQSYIELCMIQNGGRLKYDAFPTSVPTGWADDHVCVDEIFGIEEEGILASEYYIKEWKLPNNIILLYGDGHWWIALDYRNTKENPPIIYVDLEFGEEIFILELAPDFETFVNGLFIYEDEEFY